MKTEEQINSGLSRRSLLVAGGGGAVGLLGSYLLGSSPAVAAASTEGPDPQAPSICGQIGEVQNEERLLLEGCVFDIPGFDSAAVSESGTFVLEISDQAIFWRDGSAKLTDFNPGDKVIAYVSVSGDEVEAVVVEPLYVSVTGQVSGRTGDVLATSGGLIALTSNTQLIPTSDTPQVGSIDDIQPGCEVSATCVEESEAGHYLANTIGVVGR